MKNRRFPAIQAIAACLVLVCTPLLAGKMQTKDKSGSDPNVDDCEDCECNADWNPSIGCGADPGDTIHDLLNCMIQDGEPLSCGSGGLDTPSWPGTGIGDQQQNQDISDGSGSDDDGCIIPGSTGNYIVRQLLPPEIGLEILREDGSEIDNLTIWEDFPGIEWTELEVNQPGLTAFIREFTATPTGGLLQVILNDRLVVIPDTAVWPSGFELSRELATQMQLAGFDARFESPLIVVRWDDLAQKGLTRVGVISEDPALVVSQLSLEVEETADDTSWIRLRPLGR